jgi:hypothetical protein
MRYGLVVLTLSKFVRSGWISGIDQHSLEGTL